MRCRVAWLPFALATFACARAAHAQDAGAPAPIPHAFANSPSEPGATPAPAAGPPQPGVPPKVDLGADDAPDYFTKRFEPAGFPLIGGTSDIGFEFGGVLTLTKFGDGTRPYAWNMDVVLSASVKSLQTGLAIAQQNYLWQLDVPDSPEVRLRLNPEAQYSRTINAGYYGLGNASGAVRPVGAAGNYFQYIHQEAGARHITRYALFRPVDLMLSTTLRYVNPGVYAGSQLAADSTALRSNGTALITGLEGLGIVGQAVGFVYDTRESEIFPKSGSFHQIGLKVAQSLNDGHVRYGEGGLILAKYTPLGGPFILATRAIVDLQFGNVPFFELYNGEVFVPDQIPGGSAGVRGVPEGRYLGPIKVVANAELRAMWVGFHFLGQTFHVGDNVFFDTGRVWSDYTFHSPLDGKGVGLKWGAGAGAYLLWGQAAIFRLEVAYSPDAEAENPGFPVGVYVEDGVMF